MHQVTSVVTLDSESQLEILSQFHNAVEPGKAVPEAWLSFWHDKLSIPFRTAADHLFGVGLLREASFAEKLIALNTVAGLRAIAKQNGLKVSGRKAELAARIAEQRNHALATELAGKSLWVCSAEAQQAVERHRAEKKQKLADAQRETLHLLRSRKLRDACHLVCEYRRSQFFPHGVGVDWSSSSTRLLQELKAAYSASPRFHVRRFGPIQDSMRDWVAMSVLWDEMSFPGLFDQQISSVPKEQTTLWVRMFCFYLSNMHNLAQDRSSSLDLVSEVVTVEDQNTTCDACLRDSGRVYSLSDAPELPHEFCDCEIGCRCMHVARLKGF